MKNVILVTFYPGNQHIYLVGYTLKIANLSNRVKMKSKDLINITNFSNGIILTSHFINWKKII